MTEVAQLLARVVDGGIVDSLTATSIGLPPSSAHVVAEAPYVTVAADRWDAAGWERGWTICVTAFIEAEACDAMDTALDALRADIKVGKVERGSHRGRLERDPLGVEG